MIREMLQKVNGIGQDAGKILSFWHCYDFFFVDC